MKNLNSEADVRSTRKYLLLLEINENNSEKEKSSDTDPEEDNYFLFHMGWKQWFWIRTPVYPHIFSEIKTPKGRLSKLQEYRLEEISNHGCITEVYRG